MAVKFLTGDALAVLRTLPTGSVQACITSPPYMGLRDYGTGTWAGGDAACDHAPRANRDNRPRCGLEGGTDTIEAATIYRTRCGKCGAIRTDHQIGLEPTIDAYVAALVEVMREVRRVLHDSGVALVNLGDSARDKQLLMIPARVALALQADGWVLRSMMPWLKRSAMPESVTDRPASAVEYVFLLAKRSRYFWDAAAIQRAGDSRRADVPGSNDVKGREDQFGTRGFAERMRKETTTTGWRQSCACPAAPPVPQTVLDPFSGAGTTALCAHRLGRDAIGVELNPDYVAMARARLEADAGMFADVGAVAVAPLRVPDAAQCELFATLVAAQ